MGPEVSIPFTQNPVICSYRVPDKSIPRPAIPIFLISILILSSHQHPGLTNGLIHSAFPTKALRAFLLIRAIYPAHLIPLDLVTLKIFVEEYKSRSFGLRIFIQSSVTSYVITKNKPHMTVYCSGRLVFCDARLLSVTLSVGTEGQGEPVPERLT